MISDRGGNMGSPYLEGEKALERLGDLTELIFRSVEGSSSGSEANDLIEEVLHDMGAALRERDVARAKKLVMRMLTEVLGYDEVRAKFVMNNHLNKNAGWD
jgi:hypothetical protein